MYADEVDCMIVLHWPGPCAKSWKAIGKFRKVGMGKGVGGVRKWEGSKTGRRDAARALCRRSESEIEEERAYDRVRSGDGPFLSGWFGGRYTRSAEPYAHTRGFCMGWGVGGGGSTQGNTDKPDEVDEADKAAMRRGW